MSLAKSEVLHLQKTTKSMVFYRSEAVNKSTNHRKEIDVNQKQISQRTELHVEKQEN